MNPNMFAKVILASKPTNGAPPIITIHARYPRIIHGEVMTHRVFSRNARSSRAVPVANILAEIKDQPFVPWHWGKNQKGMQATQENNALVSVPTFSGGCEDLTNEQAWLRARDFAVLVAEGFAYSNYHKQVVNRLTEPYSWIDTLITSTSWANFMHLRDHKDAEPHFQDLAGLIRDAIAGATYQTLQPGEWHLPYVTKTDVEAVEDYLEPYPETTHPTLPYLQKLSVARCARISYRPFDGNASIEAEIERHDRLVASDPLHASPAEHQASPDEKMEGHVGPYGEWRVDRWKSSHLAGNLGPGYIQYRKTLPGEYIADAA